MKETGKGRREIEKEIKAEELKKSRKKKAA
jgi:hypothetical protein